MHHTVAWRLSSTDATLVDQTPVPDQVWAINNAHFVPTVDWFLLYGYVGAAAVLNRARLNSPTFRQITPPWIRPLGTAIVPTDEPNIADYRDNPLRVRGLEELALEAMQTTGGAAVIASTAGFAKQLPTPAPKGDVFTMRGTGATTAVAGAWTLAPITWADNLPNGQYAIVGLEAIGTTMVAARLVFEEQVERPGTVGQSLGTGNNNSMFRKGGLGIWGRFTSNRMPLIEIFCNAADTAQEVYVDLIRMG